jgi:hypothetical protein
MSSCQTEISGTSTKSALTEINASTVTAFIFGVLTKEIYTFISEGGLSGEYPLSKSLFVMVLCIMALAALSVPRFLNVEESVEDLKRQQFPAKFLKPSASS